MANLFITLIILLILIGLNALYVLAEFSTVSSRRARLTQLSAEGNLTAKQVLSIVNDPTKLDAFVATSQVGITISSLVLGFFGQARLAPYLMPFFQNLGDFTEAATISISTTIVLIGLTLIQVLFGELIPKNLGIQEPERFSIFTYQPLRWSSWFFKPLITLFNGSGILLMRLMKIEPSSEHGHIHSPEEISILIEESGKGGKLSIDEYTLLTNTMQMREAMVKEVMIPRAQMLAAPDSMSISDITKLLSESPYSRIPIFHENIDKIIGIIHLRDLFCLNGSGKKTPNTQLNDIIHPVNFVPETIQVKDVFSMLQKNQNQVAIILDEFGGTSGLVTIEDLIEEIFGDLHDEFDQNLQPIKIVSDTKLLIRGDTLIKDLNNILGWDLSADEFDTVGGLILDEAGRIPTPDEVIIVGDHNFSIEKTSGRAIVSVVLTSTKETVDRYRKLL